MVSPYFLGRGPKLDRPKQWELRCHPTASIRRVARLCFNENFLGRLLKFNVRYIQVWKHDISFNAGAVGTSSQPCMESFHFSIVGKLLETCCSKLRDMCQKGITWGSKITKLGVHFCLCCCHFYIFFHFLSFQTQVLEIISHLSAYAHWSLTPSHAFGFSVSRIRPRPMAQANHRSCSTQKLVDCTWKTSGNISVSPLVFLVQAHELLELLLLGSHSIVWIDWISGTNGDLSSGCQTGFHGFHLLVIFPSNEYSFSPPRRIDASLFLQKKRRTEHTIRTVMDSEFV